jgi:thymidylate synthase (FAD)
MNELIKVLDHGHVPLVESMGNDLSIVRNARVSYDAEWRAGDDEGKDQKLVHYLWKNRHTSPFESVQFTFDIKCPIFVARQRHRHRTWCLAGSTPLVSSRPVDGKSYRECIE